MLPLPWRAARAGNHGSDCRGIDNIKDMILYWSLRGSLLYGRQKTAASDHRSARLYHSLLLTAFGFGFGFGDGQVYSVDAMIADLQ